MIEFWKFVPPWLQQNKFKLRLRNQKGKKKRDFPSGERAANAVFFVDRCFMKVIHKSTV